MTNNKDLAEKKKMSAKDDPCWPGYHMVGKKTKNGREVPNCVPGKKGVAEDFKNTYSVGDRVDSPLGTGTIVAVSKNINVDGRVKVKLDDPSRAGEDGKYKDSFVLDTTQLKHISEQGVAEETKPSAAPAEPTKPAKPTDTISIAYQNNPDYIIYHSKNRNAYAAQGVGKYNGKIPRKWFKRMSNAAAHAEKYAHNNGQEVNESMYWCRTDRMFKMIPEGYIKTPMGYITRKF